ncbi:MAG: hypothetical protein N3B16_11025 [Candidatus Aminicenantes bacterium]|nr:hypothetical protein [Candidatus Aminicenantes bacterium]
MSIVNLWLKTFLDILFFPCRSFSPWIALIFISFLTGLFLLAVYKVFSNQQKIKIAKNRIKAHLLELRLFSDDLVISLQAQGQLFFWNLKYFLQVLRPLVIMVIPLSFLLSHLNLWFAWEPMPPGERMIVKIKLKEGVNLQNFNISLESTEGYEVETPPLRIEAEKEINWRIKALKSGKFEMPFWFDNQKITKEIIIGSNSWQRLSPVRPASGLIRELLNPGERPLSDSLIEEIVISYPSRRLNFFGLKIHWLIAYFFLSIITGLILKRPLKVEI